MDWLICNGGQIVTCIGHYFVLTEMCVDGLCTQIVYSAFELHLIDCNSNMQYKRLCKVQ